MSSVFRNIVVPTDFSDPARNAMRFALELLHPEGTIHCLHVVDDVPLTYGYVGMTLPADDVRVRMSQSAEDELEAFIPAGADLARMKKHVLHGAPHEAIVQFARDHRADMIAMGTHGRTGIEHALLGSVAEKVLRRAPCPVFVVREGGAGFASA